MVRPADGHEYTELKKLFPVSEAAFNDARASLGATVRRGRPRKALRANHAAGQSDVNAMFGVAGQ
eukprot:SAG11_NODE_587_length_8334_cov_94.063509_3_plen_65_part_00